MRGFGVTIFMEGLHHRVPRATVYLPMGFALTVELLHMPYEHKRKVPQSKGGG